MPPSETAMRRGKYTPKFQWQNSVPIVARAMVLAGQTLWVSGPVSQENNVTLAQVGSDQPGQLIALTASKGSVMSEYELSSTPILDGMIAVSGRLLFSCEDGTVRCFEGRL
jgi:outer membrane protein assembly factor BamB